ncbi:MAG: hypothetical protein DRJ69_03925 [Thermoprotei archaeon]|nr:MAG: hypothetical protein DRJ69_03925 [Thermoprotei archaeon]
MATGDVALTYELISTTLLIFRSPAPPLSQGPVINPALLFVFAMAVSPAVGAFLAIFIKRRLERRG